ncbi:MAG TPA: hypothetical protein VLX31_11270 [Streptosporangiaceae bacterium]|nr:hypothetical protein [Streptosporangiaceae bacterium]
MMPRAASPALASTLAAGLAEAILALDLALADLRADGEVIVRILPGRLSVIGHCWQFLLPRPPFFMHRRIAAGPDV